MPDICTAEQYKLDFQTPPEVCNYMASMVPKGVKDVLEPCAGSGNLVRALEKVGLNVTAPEDYFLLKKRRFGGVVMNPPFSSKYAFLQNAPVDVAEKGMRLGYRILTECMDMSDHVIALMPWFTLSDSDVRLRYLKGWGIKSLTALPRKTFQYARIQTVVIEMEKGWAEPTEFKVFDLLNPQPKLFDFARKEASNA